VGGRISGSPEARELPSGDTGLFRLNRATRVEGADVGRP
jgi:hypothetical protein